jgi:hypothetical protein
MRRFGFIGAILPLAAAVIRDLANHNGVLRSIRREMLERREENRQKVMNANFTVVDDGSGEKQDEKLEKSERLENRRQGDLSN